MMGYLYDRCPAVYSPFLLIILLDQSIAMQSSLDGKSKAEIASTAVNKVIDNIIQKNQGGETVKNRCFISVIGYNHNVKEVASGWLAQLAKSPLRFYNLKKKISDGAGGILEIEEKMPVWIEPIAQDTDANMFGAFKKAKALIENWVIEYPESPAPIIFNFASGVARHDGKNSLLCEDDVKNVGKEIRNIHIKDGPALIYNWKLTKSGVSFPDKRENLDRHHQFIYDITSEIPESYYRDAAIKFDMLVEEGARGCIFGADGIAFVGLLPEFGS